MSGQSVHLSDWPAAGKIDQKLEADMVTVRKICELGHAARKEAKIKVRQPLIKVSVSGLTSITNLAMLQLIKEELNVKKVEFKKGKEIKVVLDTKISAALKAEGEARDLARAVQNLRKEKGCRLDEKITLLLPEIPQNETLIQYIKEKTLAKKLLTGKQLAIKRS
jgi:isoleucyl-tRNA synthetase